MIRSQLKTCVKGNSKYRHLAAEALSRDVRRVEGLHLGVVEEQPAVAGLVLAVPDERVVVPAVRRARVYCHAYQLVSVYTHTVHFLTYTLLLYHS